MSKANTRKNSKPGKQPPLRSSVTVAAFLKTASITVASPGRAQAHLVFRDKQDRHEWFVCVPADLAKPFAQALETAESSDGVSVLIRVEMVGG